MTTLYDDYIKSDFVLCLSAEFFFRVSLFSGFVSSFDADEMLTRAVLNSTAMQRAWVQ